MQRRTPSHVDSFSLFMGGAFIGGVILALLFRLGWLDALFSRGPAYMSLDQNWNQMLTPDEQHVTHLEKALESVQTDSLASGHASHSFACVTKDRYIRCTSGL